MTLDRQMNGWMEGCTDRWLKPQNLGVDGKSQFCSWIFGHFFNWRWGNFVSKIAKFSKKIGFFTPASTVNRKNLGSHRSKIYLPSARAAKTL